MSMLFRSAVMSLFPAGKKPLAEHAYQHGMGQRRDRPIKPKVYAGDRRSLYLLQTFKTIQPRRRRQREQLADPSPRDRNDRGIERLTRAIVHHKMSYPVSVSFNTFYGSTKFQRHPVNGEPIGKSVAVQFAQRHHRDFNLVRLS